MSRPPLHIALAIAATVLLSTGTAAASPAPGGAWGWGDNADGQLGNGTITRYGGEPVAVQVKNLTNVQALAGGSNFSVALKTDGTVWAWGNNGWGQLGQGNYQSSTVPLQVPGLRGVRAIAAGALTGLALQSDGTVKAWGFNYYGQVGDGVSGPNELSPVSVRGLTGVVAVAAGPSGFTSYALKSDGTVWDWGYNGLGQLGNAASDESAHPMPSRVSRLTGVVAIGAGSSHALAVRSDGTVRDWGSNQFRQLGARTTTTCTAYLYPCSTTPVRPRNLSGIVAVAGGGNFSLALKSDGSVWGWGDNAYGELALGTSSMDRIARATKTELRSAIAIAAGDQHVLALDSSGAIFAAGDNERGQLGDGTFAMSRDPVRVINLRAATMIAAGADHSLAVVP